MVVQVFGKDASWSLPYGGVPGTSGREETTGKTRIQVERLNLCTGLGMPQDPPVSVG